MKGDPTALVFVSPWGVILGAFAIRALWKVTRSMFWPHVEGTILAADIGLQQDRVNQFSGPPQRVVAHIRYRYTVAGREYMGERIRLARTKSNLTRLAQADVQRFSEGARVKVYYDPDDPANAVLDPGSFVYLIPYLVLLLLGLGFIYLGVKLAFFPPVKGR